MAKTIIDISDDKLAELEPYKGRLGELLLLGLSQIKIQEVLLLYQRNLLSFGRAAELAGLSEQEMIRQARAFGVVPRWSEKMAEEETA
ncbi:MAG: antitoxin [Syntrophobacterales bacterium CG23_combo_of_CG06-09_8_20_14_all_48_27]|nr:MAG: antitoxin [Syntrophobacterales bacterium CG23_combo_of_CG06-09_8_20_14_all_48_27]